MASVIHSGSSKRELMPSLVTVLQGCCDLIGQRSGSRPSHSLRAAGHIGLMPSCYVRVHAAAVSTRCEDGVLRLAVDITEWHRPVGAIYRDLDTVQRIHAPIGKFCPYITPTQLDCI